MAKSPESPPPDASGTESLPWAPSPGSQDPLEGATAIAEGFTEGPGSAEEAIGGGSHPAAQQHDAHSLRAKLPDAAASAAELQQALRNAIAARPLTALGIAAAIGFLAARVLRH